MKNNRAQGAMVMAFIGVFLFAIIATALLPTIADSVNNAKVAVISVTNETGVTLFNANASDASFTSFTVANFPIINEANQFAVFNGSGSTEITTVCSVTPTSPCYNVTRATGFVEVNLSLSSNDADSVTINYQYQGSSNLSGTDDALISLWPLFIIIGGLLAILGAVGLR